MSTYYDWSPFFNAANNAISQWGQRNQYNSLINQLVGTPTQTPGTVGAPAIPGMSTGLNPTLPQLPGGPVPQQQAPVNLNVGGSAATPGTPGGTAYSGLAGQALGSSAAAMLPLLKNVSPQVGLPLLLNLATKNAERKQEIADRALTPMTQQEKVALGFKPDSVIYKDQSGNPVVAQGSDMLSQGAVGQKLDISRQEGQIAAQNPLTKYQQAEIGVQNSQLNKPVSVGFGDTLVNPQTGKAVYGGGMGAGQVPTDKNGQPLSGDAFLATVPPQYRNQVKALGEYRQAPLTAMALRSPVGAQLSTWVNQAYPGYDASQYGAKVKARTDFVSGPDGKSLTAINTAVDHLGTLGQLSQALGNGDVQALNSLSQTWAQQTGNPAPTNFEAMKQIVGDEIVKALVGTGGSAGDREHAAATISRASSPQQLAGAIQTYQQALAGKLGPLRTKYHYNTKLNDFNDMLTPTTRSILGALPQGDAAPAKTPPPTGSAKPAPAGVDPKVWSHMTPQEQALWTN